MQIALIRSSRLGARYHRRSQAWPDRDALQLLPPPHIASPSHRRDPFLPGLSTTAVSGPATVAAHRGVRPPLLGRRLPRCRVPPVPVVRACSGVAP
jgi:hypothetical protein